MAEEAEPAIEIKGPGKLRRLVACLGWLLLCSALALCLAVILRVGRIPQLSLFNYAPIYPFAVVPLFGVILARRRAVALPIGVLFALCILLLSGFGFGIGLVRRPAGDPLRLISYNIEDWHGSNKQGFYDLIEAFNPHVLALQEVWGPWDVHDHRWDPIRHYQWGDTAGRHAGLLPDLKPVRYEILDEYGNAVLVECRGRQFWIASVQFPRGIDSVRAIQIMPTERRREQGRFTRYLADWLKDKPDVVVVGDFNSLAHGWFIRTLGLRNPWVTTGLGIGGTYKVNMPVARIDHALVKGRIRPVSSRTIYLTDFSNHRGNQFEFLIDDIPQSQPVEQARGDDEEVTP